MALEKLKLLFESAMNENQDAGKACYDLAELLHGSYCSIIYNAQKELYERSKKLGYLLAEQRLQESEPHTDDLITVIRSNIFDKSNGDY